MPPVLCRPVTVALVVTGVYQATTAQRRPQQYRQSRLGSAVSVTSRNGRLGLGLLHAAVSLLEETVNDAVCIVVRKWSIMQYCTHGWMIVFKVGIVEAQADKRDKLSRAMLPVPSLLKASVFFARIVEWVPVGPGAC